MDAPSATFREAVVRRRLVARADDGASVPPDPDDSMTLRVPPLLPTVLAAALLAGTSLPAAAVDVGVSINFAQPGVYGRVDIGRFPAPVLVAPAPVIAPVPVVVGAPRPAVVVARPEPMYLWVPPGHRANWNRYCGQYHACGHPVYFVKDDWYHQKVMVHKVPPGQAKKIERVEVERRDGDGEGHGNGNGHGRGKGH